jgi:uncharacterized protein involved in response to NO
MRMSAFLSMGFRPFYLGAAVFAAAAVPAWLLAYSGSSAYLQEHAGYFWHMHEMLFGFAPAVIAGFLLTAVRNWTGLPTATGPRLGALFALWVLGRLLPFLAPPWIAALVDIAFLPALAVSLAIPLWRARNRRNAFVIAVLCLLWLANLLFHAARFGILEPGLVPRSVTLALDLILVLLIVIGGRVIPAFSANAVPGLEPRSWPPVEFAAIGLVVALIALDAIGNAAITELATGYTVLLYVAAGVHLIRLAGWAPWRTRRNFLLLMLPLSYLWIPIHLGIRAWQDGQPGFVAPVAAHALFVGAMASMMVSMMTRSALGHTGRSLAAGAAEVTCFVSIQLAAIARTLGPWLTPGHYDLALTLSGSFWTLAFAAFAAAYAPRLLLPRQDTAAGAAGPR